MTKILLVEDDKSLREIYGVRLLAEGYDIISAGDGEAALAMAIKDRPQLIVSDVMMPKISGFDMLDILRSTTETKEIKVIMMTALSSDDQRQRGEQLGADRYLVKSQVGIEDVVRTVHDVLQDTPGVGQQPVASPKPDAPAATPAQTPAAPSAPPTSPVSAPAAPTTNPSPAAATPAPPPPPSQSPAPSAPSTPQPAQPSPMPQPTAPFSTQRPANLGDRVIHPIEKPADDGPDISERISQELDAHQQANDVPPAPTPPTPPAPQPPAPAPEAPSPSPTPLQPITTSEPEAPPSHDMNFEETPRNTPQPPATPQS